MRRRLRPKRRKLVRRFIPRRQWLDDEDEDNFWDDLAAGGGDEKSK